MPQNSEDFYDQSLEKIKDGLSPVSIEDFKKESVRTESKNSYQTNIYWAYIVMGFRGQDFSESLKLALKEVTNLDLKIISNELNNEIILETPDEDKIMINSKMIRGVLFDTGEFQIFPGCIKWIMSS